MGAEASGQASEVTDPGPLAMTGPPGRHRDPGSACQPLGGTAEDGGGTQCDTPPDWQGQDRDPG